MNRNERFTESLFVVDSASVDVGENGRLVEVTRKIDLLSSYNNLGSILDGIFNVGVNLVDSGLVNERTVSDTFSSSFSNLEVSDGFSKFGGEGIVNSVLNVDSIGADTLIQ